VRRPVSCLVVVALALSLFAIAAPAAHAAPGDPIYVSVGDSLSVGYQPGRGRTDSGYVDELWSRVRLTMPRLELRKFGCPGETTQAMISGLDEGCEYAAGTQLDAAVKFLQNRSADVAFITIDIGVNDVLNRCMDFHTGILHRKCDRAFRPKLRHRLMHIVDDLRTAVGTDIPIVGMTYYDPFLGFWGLVAHGRRLAHVDARAWVPFNRGLRHAYVDAGAVVANVARTFRINDFGDTVFVQGRGPLPLNVARTCRWTWFCTRRFFGDPHPNPTGYQKIGGTFFRRLKPLL
jgi:lysophospholipase L1-like esterase